MPRILHNPRCCVLLSLSYYYYWTTTTTGLDWTGPQSHKPCYFTCFLTHHLSHDRACAGGKNCNTNTRYKHFRSLEDGILGLCIVSESKFRHVLRHVLRPDLIPLNYLYFFYKFLFLEKWQLRGCEIESIWSDLERFRESIFLIIFGGYDIFWGNLGGGAKKCRLPDFPENPLTCSHIDILIKYTLFFYKNHVFSARLNEKMILIYDKIMYINQFNDNFPLNVENRAWNDS